MFISQSRGGYSRNGEQFCRGRFLLLFSHNQYLWEDENNHPHIELHGQTFDITNGEGFVIQRKCQCAGSAPYTYEPGAAVPSYYLKYCPVHSGEYKQSPSGKEWGRKLYACVRHVSLRQMGHWMMGSARIAGQSVTCSGTYGSDGLPKDYEKLTPAARTKLVEVPADIADIFWAGGGWNDAGKEGPDMMRWALKTFPKGVRS